MTTSHSPAVHIALAYHDAWTGHDLDAAMSPVAEDIECHAPGGRIDGAAGYRQFLGGCADRRVPHHRRREDRAQRARLRPAVLRARTQRGRKDAMIAQRPGASRADCATV